MMSKNVVSYNDLVKPKKARGPYLFILFLALGSLVFTGLRWFETSKYNTSSKVLLDAMIVKSNDIDAAPKTPEGKRLAAALKDEKTRKIWNEAIEKAYSAKKVIAHKLVAFDIILVHEDPACKELELYQKDSGRKVRNLREIIYNGTPLLLAENGTAIESLHTNCSCVKN